jgi:hypothetical protein
MTFLLKFFEILAKIKTAKFPQKFPSQKLFFLILEIKPMLITIMDQTSKKTRNSKCRLFLKIYQEMDLAAGV